MLTEEAHSHSKQNGWSKVDAGELVVINCGQASLKRAVQAGRLNAGDLMQLEMSGIEPLSGGRTVKVFKIRVKRGNGELSQRAQEAMSKAAADDKAAAATTNGSDDPWGSAPPANAFADGADEPPF
ncbi:MAG TPA: hypothetical protein VJ777_21225 [Mycobacterium sp.]|nr:hypothetical protein [Mycobacterium sp.]